jgi:transposase
VRQKLRPSGYLGSMIGPGAEGTLLVDLEAHRVTELLPDRSTQALTRWLYAHPEVEVISRDRAGAYAEAAEKGAPQAIQVAELTYLAQAGPSRRMRNQLIVAGTWEAT